MRLLIKINVIAIIYVMLLTVQISNAVTFFSDGFETGETKVGTTEANPVWSWPSVWTPTAIGMMYGVGDIYERSMEHANSGTYSLRLNFSGRNDWCNQDISGCTTYANSADGGTNMIDGAGANLDTAYDIGDHIFNVTKYFEKWPITGFSNSAATNDQADTSGSPDLGPIHSQVGGNFNIDDSCRICTETEATTRNDCDLAITYLSGIQSSDLDYGESIFRRRYIYIPSETTIPNINLKIGYIHDGTGQANWICIYPSRSNDIEYEGNITGFGLTGVSITRDFWWYIEEQFQAESSSGSSDGVYRIWAGVAGSVPTDAIAEETGLSFSGLRVSDGMSFMGNFQNNTTATGYMYIDDFAVADTRIGEVDSDTTPPTVTAFAIPATYTSIPVPVTTFTATDDVGVTGYIVTALAVAPAYTDSGWTPSPPTELDFLSEGANTVYAWAKDAAGNVSTSATDDCTVTLPEPGITWEDQPTWSVTWEDKPTWGITWE